MLRQSLESILKKFADVEHLNYYTELGRLPVQINIVKQKEKDPVQIAILIGTTTENVYSIMCLLDAKGRINTITKDIRFVTEPAPSFSFLREEKDCRIDYKVFKPRLTTKIPALQEAIQEAIVDAVKIQISNAK